MKYLKTCFLFALFVLLIGVFPSGVRAQNISKMELYPGINKAVTEARYEWNTPPYNIPSQKLTLAQRINAKAVMSQETLDVSFHVDSEKFYECVNATLSFDVWLVSKHQSKQRSRELNEKNHGYGLVYTCGRWSLGLDQMINSNKGKAQVLSLVWSTENLEVGPFFVNGNVGYARLSYEVPRYNITLYDSTKIAFVGTGLNVLPQVQLNFAPVPKMAGKAWITWLKVRLLQFDAFFQLKW